MRLVIKNSIQLCLRALVLSIVLRHSNYNNKIISIEGTFLGDILYSEIAVSVTFVNSFSWSVTHTNYSLEFFQNPYYCIWK